ncbi:hypothetical protein ACNSOP_08475 [Aliarcobacter lanthieri]|uniref:hypothetical protein n=1 Tax=Arcobacteraceae TaxID=2808963 RepID=UPI000DEB10E5|nr:MULTISPECIES: hypothetical protein [Arcobacteraceae]MBL3520924.1 hypothetical protein [Aliarcobacter lanthieri]RBQ26020.1 hypothetical protein CRU88_09380 [Arcobacter sp. CECT 9188]
MKKHQKFIFLTILFTFVLFSIGLFIRYIIDPVGINNKFDIGLRKDTALAYRTQKYVELNELQPNTILLGGSRVHYLNPKDIEKYTQDKVYNLGLQFATLEEQYYFLKHSLENLPIHNVIIGLNFYTFNDDLKENGSDFNKDIFEYGFNFFYQVKHYLEVPIFKYLKYVIPNNDRNLFYENGAITLYHQEKVIKNNNKEHMWKGTLNYYKKVYKDFHILGEKNFDYYKKMVELCNQYNVKLKVFTTAIHTSQLKLIEEENKLDIFDKWKNEIAQIFPYWDFMTDNSITEDDDNFIDSSHIKQELGSLYFGKIFEDFDLDIPEDFGIFIE